MVYVKKTGTLVVPVIKKKERKKMLELKVRIREVSVEKKDESNDIIYLNYVPNPQRGYKGVAKMLWRLLHKNHGHHLWINTDVYVRKHNRWIYFMSFDDKLFPQPGSLFCKRNFSTRKRVQGFLRLLRKCQERALKTEEVPERLGITDDIHVSFER